ncbi:MAG: formylglycine-generating enzyme family protein [Anaerolineales bacterium]|nr:formylglycine-generating enzyme family protein [Anaerolineales bacterium]
MTGLSSDLYRRCREVLLRCAEFDTNAALRTVFITPELIPFRDGMPEASSRTDRVDAVIAYLTQKYYNGHSALALFVKMLYAKTTNGDNGSQDLKQLQTEIEYALEGKDNSQQNLPKPSGCENEKGTSVSHTSRLPLPSKTLLGIIAIVIVLITPVLVKSFSLEANQMLTPTAVTTPRTIATPTPTSLPNVGDTWTRPEDKMPMVFVPNGRFQMGSTEGDSDEQPTHLVILDAFWIDKTEVTVAQFQVFADQTGYKTDAEKSAGGYIWTEETGWIQMQGINWQHPQTSTIQAIGSHPVVHVSWNDAKAYCEWANSRLPTEAEWEYAARGPKKYTYPWGNEWLKGYANCTESNCVDGYEYTAPVGSFPLGESWVGVSDMAGNVWEWVEDWSGPYPSEKQINPVGPISGQSRLVRGGSWLNLKANIRSTDRLRFTSSNAYFYVGFRCVKDSIFDQQRESQNTMP